MKKLLEKISHIIIPHKRNNNIPHILKEEFILVLVIFIGILFYFNQNNFSIIQKLNLTATVYPVVLADLANQDRAVSGVSELTWSGTLENAAKLKAEDMLKNGYFAHTSPSGVTPWYWLSEVDYNFIYAGENLAIDFTESVNVEKAWINSPKHKENILNSHFTEIGIATIDGLYKGRNTTFVVEFFGKPTKEKVALKSTTDTKLAVDNTDKIINPTVAGVSTNIKIIEETKDFIVIKNDAINEEIQTIPNNLEVKQFSTWYDRFIFNPTNTIRIIYTIIFSLILISILLVLSKEYRKHHSKHIIIGIITMAFIIFLVYIISA